MLPVEMEDHELTDFETLVQNLTPGDLRALAHIPPGWHDCAAPSHAALRNGLHKCENPRVEYQGNLTLLACALTAARNRTAA